jgi:hypothetical protein
MKPTDISSGAARIAMVLSLAVPGAAMAESERNASQRNDPQGASMSNTSTSAASEFSQAELVGKTLYDWGEQKIGEIKGIVHADGKLRAVLVDVGGFLGLGEKKGRRGRGADSPQYGRRFPGR